MKTVRGPGANKYCVSTKLKGNKWQDYKQFDEYLKRISCRSNGYSMMPVVGTRTRKISCCVGK